MKTVLITGGATGIGKATVQLFAQQGYHVALQYHKSQAAALALKTQLSTQGFDVQAFHCDITKQSEVEAMFVQLKQALGGVDVVVNNSGLAQQKLFTDLTEQDWNNVFDVNVKGAFFVSQEAVRQMLPKQQGAVINISSMWGQVGASCEVHYSASKAALIGLTKALAKEVAPSHIRVNCICPGVIDTPMNASLSEETKQQLAEETPLGRIGTAEEIANAILFLSQDTSSFITGQVLGVNGGLII